MIGTLIVGLGLAFFTMFIWYITQPVVITIINETMDTAIAMNANNTYVTTAITILKNIEYWWGPLLVGAIAILWLFVAAQRRDWTSETSEI